VVSDLDRLNRGLVVMYPLPIAQQLFGRPGGLDAIFVIPRPGVGVDTVQARLEGLVGPQNKVTSASETSDSVRFVSAQILPFLLLISLFGLAVGAQLVYNTMTLSLEERRRELAVASAVGSTPNMVLGGVLAEAAVLGVLGGVVGVVMGALVSRPFISTLSRYAEQAAGIHLQVHVTAPNLVLGLSMGVLASMLAAIVPARRAARLDIAGELAARGRRADAAPAVRARRATVLVSLTLGGLAAAWFSARDGALEPWQPNVMLAGVLIAFVCGFALPPALAPFALRLIARLPVLNRGPARVAMGTLVSETRRTSAVFMAVGAAVGMSFTLGSVLPGMAFGAEQLTQQTAYDRVMVTTLEPNNNSGVDAKLSPALQAALGDVPGVEGVEHVYHATADLAGVGSVGLSADDGLQRRYPLLRGVDATEAIAGGDVMIGPALARDLSLRPGDSLDLPGRFGTVRMTVGGIWQAPDQLGRSITVPAATFVALVGPRPPDWVLLRPAPGVSPVELARRVRDLRLADNLRIFDPAALSIEYAANFEEFVKPFEVLSRGLLAVTFIATVSTLLLASVQRRREHGLLAAVGMPPGDLGRMVLVEAGMIGLLGTLLGGLSGLVGLEGFAISSATLTGLDIPFRLSIAPLLVYGSIVTACVLAGAALPAWRTSRLDPVVALRQD
jgi:putative ABC transport system permease protein